MKASLARLWTSVVRHAFAAVDIVVMSSHSANAAEEPRLMSGSGTPTVALTTVGLYMNKSASGMNDLLGAYVGGAWTWAELDATASAIVDGSTWYTTDTLQGIADAVVAAIGGTRTGVVGDLAVAGASGILFTFDGGAAPAIQATDVLTVTAWS